MFGAKRVVDRNAAARLHVPLSLAAALDGRVQDLLRTAAEDLRGARSRRRSRPCNDDIMALIDRMNLSGDDTMVVPSEYLELVISKR